jgi:hypothetical protein
MSDMCFISLKLLYICVCSCGAGSPDSCVPAALQSEYACECLQQRLPTFTAWSQFHREPFIVSGKYRLVCHHHHHHHHHHHNCHHLLFPLGWIKGQHIFLRPLSSVVVTLMRMVQWVVFFITKVLCSLYTLSSIITWFSTLRLKCYQFCDNFLFHMIFS